MKAEGRRRAQRVPSAEMTRGDRETPLIRPASILRAPGHRALGEARGEQPSRKLEGPVGAADDNRRAGTGEIDPETTVIESTSGNLGVGLAQACRYLGLRLICVVDSRTHEINLQTMRAFGAEVRVVDRETAGDRTCSRPDSTSSASWSPTTPDAYWPNQYENRSSAAAHANGTMREIDEALEGRLDYLFVATSTTGTLRGCCDYLVPSGGATRVVAVDAVRAASCSAASAGERRLPGFGAGVATELSKRPGSTACPGQRLDCVVGCRRLVDREAALRRRLVGRRSPRRSIRSRRDRAGQPLRAAVRRRRRAAISTPSTATSGSRRSSAYQAERVGELVSGAAGRGRVEARARPVRPRVAIVGAGPKGTLRARAVARSCGCGGRPTSTRRGLFDPRRRPGAGPNYDPDLPEYLRMNFAAEQIDMWPRRGRPRVASPTSRAGAIRPAAGAEPYPPRAQVGRYLSEGLGQLLDDPGRGSRSAMRRSRVERLTRDDRRMAVNDSASSLR